MRSRGVALLALALLASPGTPTAAEPRHGCIVWKTGAGGMPLRLDRDRLGALYSPLDSKQLSFTFDSPEQPWSPQELATLEGYLSDFVPALRRLIGDPAVSNTVNIVKDSTMASYASGSYSPEDNVIMLWAAHADVFCHELVHAFHDENVFYIDGFEEGTARALEIIVLDELGYYHWDSHHSALGDVYYEAMNQPAIRPGGGSFWAGQALRTLRYTLAGCAWDKVEREHPGFLKAFHEAYYERLLTDGSVRYTVAKLAALGATIASSMEGIPFESWVSRQHILGVADQFGVQIFQFPQSDLAFVFYRDGTEYIGYEEPMAGADVDWQALDGDGVVIDAGSRSTDEGGFLAIQPTHPWGADGRLTIRTRAHTSSGTVENRVLRTMQNLSGLFGVVVGEERGTVTITPLDTALAPVVCPVFHGQFVAPDLKTVAGRFHLSYAGPDGQRGERQLTKDASSYMAVIQPTGTLRSAVLVARPSVTRQGCRFLLDRPVTGPARLTLYDVSGRILQVLEVPAGSSGIDWSGTDRSGYLTHNGVIVARLTAPGIDASTRLVTLR